MVVAGAFGTYQDVGSAQAVGMFPPQPRERFAQVGNAAGIGAKLALLSRHYRDMAEEIARRMEYIELTTHPRFVEIYTAALMLPDVDEAGADGRTSGGYTEGRYTDTYTRLIQGEVMP
jgi:uncharacterized 2Fe-2S/4Fe-4S cluster protein (DUF4445 family)